MGQQKTYEFTDPESGMTLEVSGPTPPSEAVLRQMFADARKTAPPADDTPSVMESTGSKVARTVGNALPTIGGMAGGLAGAPGGPAASAGLAALGGAAGEFGRQTINAMRGRPTDSPVADAALAGLGQGAAEVVGAGAAKALSAGGKAVYRGYLKPPLSERLLPKAEQTVETAIREGLPVSGRGQQMGEALITDLHAKVDALIGPSQRTVDVKQIANGIRNYAKSKYYKPGRDLSDYEAAMSVADKLDNHPSFNIPPGVNPTAIRVRLSKAEEIKRALDDSIGDTQFGVTSGAKTATEKAARHDINKAIKAQMPEVGPLNRRQSQLIDTVKAIGRAVGREENKDALVGWRSMASGATAAAGVGAGQDPKYAAAMGLLLRGALSPAVASRVALTAVRASSQLGLGMTEAIRLALLAGTSDEVEQPQGTEK